jgi:hypothetical protein
MIVGDYKQVMSPPLILRPNQHVGSRDWLTQSDLLSKLANIERIATSLRSDLLLLFEPLGLIK